MVSITKKTELNQQHMNRHLDGRFRCSPNLLVTPKDTIGGCLWKDGIWPKIENTLKSKDWLKCIVCIVFKLPSDSISRKFMEFSLYINVLPLHIQAKASPYVSLEIEPPETSLNLFRELSKTGNTSQKQQKNGENSIRLLENLSKIAESTHPRLQCG